MWTWSVSFAFTSIFSIEKRLMPKADIMDTPARAACRRTSIAPVAIFSGSAIMVSMKSAKLSRGWRSFMSSAVMEPIDRSAPGNAMRMS